MPGIKYKSPGFIGIFLRPMYEAANISSDQLQGKKGHVFGARRIPYSSANAC